MSGRFLLDTNVVIALFAKDPSIQQHLSDGNEVFLSTTVLGELYYGACKPARVVANIARINEFAECNVVLTCDVVTAQQYDQIKNGLRAKGRPIPENNLWIAAIISQHNLTLATCDRHFYDIDGLLVEQW